MEATDSPVMVVNTQQSKASLIVLNYIIHPVKGNLSGYHCLIKNVINRMT
jgi:hypothetical protein